MADVTTGGASAPAKKGGKKPVPTWYYLVGAGLVAVAYFMYSKNKQSQAAAAAAQAAATPATAVQPVSAGSYGNAGDIASLLPYLQMSGSGNPPVSNNGVAAGAGAVGAQSGGGFLPSGTNASTIATNPGTYTATSSNGQTYTWLNPAQADAYTGKFYYEPIPGVFSPADRASLPAQTPIYASNTGV